jgi:hypothetical protein
MTIDRAHCLCHMFFNVSGTDLRVQELGWGVVYGEWVPTAWYAPAV